MATIIRLSLLLVVSALFGAALQADELRFSYVLGDESFDFNTPSSGTQEIEWDDNQRLEVTAFGSGQTVIGLGVHNQQAEASGSNWNLQYDSWTFRIYTGYTLTATQSFRLELDGFTGIGLADAELSSGGNSGDDGDFLWEYGAQVYLGMAISQDLSIGGGAGYLFSEASFDMLGEKRAIDQEGPFYFLSLGWRM